MTEDAGSENAGRVTRQRAEAIVILDSLRLHYWIKNVLLLVPAVLTNRLDQSSVGELAIGFLAFGFAASANYVLNDYVDRKHDRKKSPRLLTSNAMSPEVAAILIALLSGLAALCAWQLPSAFRWTLLTYYACCIAYSLLLKRLLVIDLVVVAGFHLLRITAGEAILGTPVSLSTLLAFGFAFLALATFKRLTQLSSLEDQPTSELAGRAYEKKHVILLTIIAMLAIASSLIALAFMLRELQIASSGSNWIWLIWPVVAGLFARSFVLANRGQLIEDLVAFFLTDAFSLASLGALAAIYVIMIL